MTAKKTVGILGGMGPEATAHFYKLFIRKSLAGRDQDHIPVIIWADPSVPDRTEAVLGLGPSPAPHILRGLRALRRAGADFAVIPCLTAHSFLNRLGAAKPLPVVSLIKETSRDLKKQWPGVKKVGLLASSGTVTSGLFQRTLSVAGIRVLIPDAGDQALVMEAIYGSRGIKAGFTGGKPRGLLLRVADRLVKRGAGAVIAGCTEVPLALRPSDVVVPFLDPMDIAARACILRAGGRIRSA